MRTKLVTINVDITFTVPAEYEVTDVETVEFGKVTLHNGGGKAIVSHVNPLHASLETREGGF